jgi:alginate O-acetyltransferase complex protein AlgJ
MMRRHSLLRTSRLLLPLAFLGYTAFANYTALAGRGGMELAEVDGSLLRGEAAAEVGNLYAKAMPHRDAAIAWIGAGRYLLVGEGRAGVVVGSDGWLFSDEELVVASSEQIMLFVREAEAAQALLDARGARLVVVPVPAKIDVHREHAPSVDVAQAMEMQYYQFLASLMAAGVEAVDVRDDLLAVAGEGQAFLARDTHWTPAGAEAVARSIAASGLVAQGSDGFLRRDGQPETVIGDLVSFVTSDYLAPRLGLGPETVTPFVAELANLSSNDIFAAGAPTPTTILVGTSYSADDRWSFAPSLSLALGRDVLNLAEQGQGPIRPLRAMLDSVARSEDAPDYVIWEVPIRYLADPLIESDSSDFDTEIAQERSM